MVPLGFAVSSCSSAVGFAAAESIMAAQTNGWTDALLITSALLSIVIFCFVWIGLDGFRFRRFFQAIVPAEVAEKRPARTPSDDAQGIDARCTRLPNVMASPPANERSWACSPADIAVNRSWSAPPSRRTR